MMTEQGMIYEYSRMLLGVILLLLVIMAEQ